MSKFHRQDALQSQVVSPQGQMLTQYPETYYFQEALSTPGNMKSPSNTDKRKKRKKKKKSSKSKY